MDGDGLPEIGVAGASRYLVLEHDGSTKWSQTTIDASSYRTGSSVFDFEGDGKAEVVYADERHLFIYDGTTGAILEQISNRSGTTLEYPVIADIDNDGHAELLLGVSSGDASSKGLLAYQSVDDNWVATRNIWNQHTYHITNINDDGTIPAEEEPSWLSHNTYRLNTFVDRDPRGAADLTATALQAFDNGAGQPFSLQVRIGNGGLASSPADVNVSFYAGDPATGGTHLGTTSTAELDAYGYRDVQLDDITLPSGTSELYAYVDSDEQIQECNETNNITNTTVPLSIMGEIAVATDARVYGPSQAVALQAVITNTGALRGEFLAELRVEDAQGTLIQSYPSRAVDPLASGADININDAWNTSNYQAGTYQLHGLLTDLDGDLIDEAESTFEIRHSADDLPLADLRTTTDQPVYHISDTAQLNNLARNLSSNTQIRDAGLRIRVIDAAGNVVFTHQQTLNELFSGAYRNTMTPYGFENAAEGVYTVIGELIDTSGNLLATDQAQFEVQADLQKELTGTVAVRLKSVQRGQTQTCTDTLTNTGSQILEAQPLRQILANLDSAESLAQSDLNITLQPSATERLIRSVETDNLSDGEYACLLQAMIVGEWTTLGYDNFSFTIPPIEIQSTLTRASLPRTLVLLDEQSTCSDDDNGDNDPDGPSNAPLLSEQRSTLNAMLSMRGDSYTIVSEGSAFTEHFLGGTYNTYALFSEQIKLSKTTQKALREAVFRGDGLVVAGDHDQRNKKLNDALGYRYRGMKPFATAVEMTDSELSTAQQLALQLEEKVIRAELTGAQSAGRFLFDGDQNADVPGVTLHAYGEGEAVHVGYDLLAEAVLAGANSPQADLLRSTLEAVAPLQDLPRMGSGVPVILTLTNQGLATPGRAIITLPEGVALIDSGLALLPSDGTLVWSFDLQESEMVSLVMWLQPLSEQNDLRIDALIQTGASPDYIDYESLSLTLALSPVPLLTDLVDELAQLVDQDTAYLKAHRYLVKAGRAQEQSKVEKAYEYLLDGSGKLSTLDTQEAREIRLKLADLIRLTGLTLASQSNPDDEENGTCSKDDDAD
jgi:hypothetical protein